MAVTEISGLAGTLPGNPDPGGLQAFAQHLAAARENDKQSALSELKFMMDLTNSSGGQFTPDPKELQKIAKRAGLGGMMGPGGKSDVFTALADTAKTKAERETQTFKTGQEKEQAQIEQLRAATDTQKEEQKRAKAQTDALIQQTGFDKAHQELENTVNEAKKRIAAGTGTEAEKFADIKTVSAFEKLTPEQMQGLGLTQAQFDQIQKDAAEERKLAHQAAQVSVMDAVSKFVRIDPKTGKPSAPTTDEINGILQGKMPPGLSTLQQQELVLHSMTAQAQVMEAQASMMRAKASGALTEAQIGDINSQKELRLAQAEALRQKGIKVPYDELLKTFDALRNMKGPADKSLREQVLKQMAAYFGGTPDEYKTWFHGLELRGFNFIGDMPKPGEGKPAAALDQAAPSTPSAYRLGQFLKQAPTGLMEGAGEIGKEGVVGMENIFRGLMGGEPVNPDTLSGPYVKPQ